MGVWRERACGRRWKDHDAVSGNCQLFVRRAGREVSQESNEKKDKSMLAFVRSSMTSLRNLLAIVHVSCAHLSALAAWSRTASASARASLSRSTTTFGSASIMRSDRRNDSIEMGGRRELNGVVAVAGGALEAHDCWCWCWRSIISRTTTFSSSAHRLTVLLGTGLG